MPKINFYLSINHLELEKYYRGHVHTILVKSDTGLKVQFPANLILPFVEHSGVRGDFILEYDQQGKAISINRR